MSFELIINIKKYMKNNLAACFDSFNSTSTTATPSPSVSSSSNSPSSFQYSPAATAASHTMTSLDMNTQGNELDRIQSVSKRFKLEQYQSASYMSDKQPQQHHHQSNINNPNANANYKKIYIVSEFDFVTQFILFQRLR